MSISDLKHTLHKYDFPMCAKEALIRTEQMLVGRGATSNKQLEVAMDIIAEYVFYEIDRRGGRRGSSLTPMQELQLIVVLCDYLSSCANDITRNTVFLSLFGGLEGLRRQRILSNLASMAFSGANLPILQAVGVWLQQMGCSSSQSLQLVESLTHDQFYLKKPVHEKILLFAAKIPQFVANFMTAVAELFMHDVSNKMPPISLLSVVTTWVYLHPHLCLSAQLNPAALPSGAIPMAAVTPLAGLIHWCALAPLYIKEEVEIVEVMLPFQKKKKKKPQPKAPLIQQKPRARPLTEVELYMKLHLGILHTLRLARKAQGPATAVNAQHLTSIIPLVQAYANGVLEKGKQLETDERYQNGLDQFAQCIQIALVTGVVYGNINSLLTSLSAIPEHRLLKIIINRHQQS